MDIAPEGTFIYTNNCDPELYQYDVNYQYMFMF